MILRKINAWLSLITAVIFFDHAIFHAVWMLSRGGIEKNGGFLTRILFAIMAAHAIISLVLVISGHIGTKKCKSYANMNKMTYIQRISGILLLPLTILHILGAVGVIQPSPSVHAILPPVFFAVCLMHTAISTGKAFITLGMGNAKSIKIADIAIKVICALIWIADVAGFYLYVA